MFPPGWLSRGTMPLATGSPTAAMTIGIVRVARWTAAVGAVPFMAEMGLVRRIGVLMPGDENDPERNTRHSAFVQALAGLGWTDRNLRIDLRRYGDDIMAARGARAAGRPSARSSRSSAAQELVGLQPSGQNCRNWGALSPSVLGSKDTTPRGRQDRKWPQYHRILCTAAKIIECHKPT